MKKLFFLLISLILLGLVSCGDGNDGDPEVISDAPENWDYVPADKDSDTGKNNDIPDTADSADTSDSGDSLPEGDTGISDDPGDHGGNGTPLPQGCGDGKVDYNERCDSEAPVTCSSLNPNLEKITKCLKDCTAYDMSTCSRKDKAWGVVNISFKTDFIMDSAKTGDPSYFAQGALPYSAFNGVYGDDKKNFPALSEGDEKVSVDGSVSFAVTSNYTGALGANRRQLFIKQNPASGYPRHELEFAPGGLKKGKDYRIDAVSTYQLIDNLLKLVRYRLIDRQDGQECILGIGYSGTVRINSIDPENVELFEGGKIDVVVDDLDFYYPTEIPGRNYEEEGPLPDEVLGKLPLCAKK